MILCTLFGHKFDVDHIYVAIVKKRTLGKRKQEKLRRNYAVCQRCDADTKLMTNKQMLKFLAKEE